MKQFKLVTLSFVLLFLCFLLIQISCQQSGAEKSELFRFIDHLKQSNIIETPLENLKYNFKSVEEDLTEKWQPMKQLSSQTLEIWAAPTKFKALGFDETQKPEGMTLVKDGEEVKFIPSGEDQDITWKWLKGDKTLAAIELKNYKRKLKCSAVNKKKSIEFSQMLPGGPVEFEITVKKRWPNAPVSQLGLFLNDNLVGDTEINSLDYEKFRFTTDVQLKYYKIKLATTKNELYVKQLKIKTASDLILLSVPKKEKIESGKSTYKVIYTSQKLKESSTSPYTSEYLVSLLEADVFPAIPDLGVPADFPSIKKKVTFKDITLNSLLAPPKSVFSFEVDIPADGVLDFGYGIIENRREDNISGVNFQVVLDDADNPQTLFSGSLNPAAEEDHRRLFFEKVDLASWANNKVKITFITEANNFQNNKTTVSGILPFWINPLIFSKKTREKPGDKDDINVILVSIDTLRWDHLSTYGYSHKISPNIDQLAAEGVQFNNCFAQSNWTLPSHVSMLTSLNSYRHQVYIGNEKMSPSLITIADILRVHDYLCSGITAGGYVSEKFGFSKGFDDYIGERHVFHAKNEAEQLRDVTLNWLERNHDKKFFLFLHTYQVHTPYYYHKGITDSFIEGDLTWDKLHLAQFLRDQPEKRKFKFSEKEKSDIIALYNGEIKYTDEYLIKPLIKKLKKMGLYDRTMIVFTSDHGEEFQDHNSWLHGHTLYNELIKVPLIIKFPESKHSGKKIDTIVRSIDIVPTILESVGIEAEPFNFDGKSLQSIVQGKETGNRTFISDFTRQGSSDFRPRMVCINQDFYKLIAIRSPSPLKFLLFDLEQDKHEITSLDPSHTSLVRSLFQKILDYYDNFKEVEAKSDKVVMDKALEEKLKALGYIR